MSWEEISKEMDKVEKIVCELKKEEVSDPTKKDTQFADTTDFDIKAEEQQFSTDQTDTVKKLIFDKYQIGAKDMDEREEKLMREGYGGARKKQSRQKQWRDSSSLTRTPPVQSSYIGPGKDIIPVSEPAIAIRGPSVIGSPPSYKRFDSPKPPPTEKDDIQLSKVLRPKDTRHFKMYIIKGLHYKLMVMHAKF